MSKDPYLEYALEVYNTVWAVATKLDASTVSGVRREAMRAAIARFRQQWQPIDTAPMDGTPILACRDNGCGWDHYIVWRRQSKGPYPWLSEGNAYPEGRFDYWMPLTIPNLTEEASQP